MIWGQTGTREGATPYQVASVGWLWSRYGITELHDGDCIGVDEQLYDLGRAFKAHVVLHPPKISTYRAYCGDSLDEVRPEKEYHERDRNVVNESSALVACPFKPYEMNHSGTWYTINYARSIERPIAIVGPNGHISYEFWTLEKI